MIQDVLDELAGIVVTAASLPITSVIYRDVRAARINWRTAIEQAQLFPPFVVIQWGPIASDPEFCSFDTKWSRIEAAVFYIDSHVTIESIDAKAMAIRDALDPAEEPVSFMTTDTALVDCSDGNPANQVFLEGNMPLLAGMVQTSLLVSF